nr:isoform 4 of cell division cycle-associated 7-like protein [Quercus suber]
MARAKRARKTSENEGNVVQNENSGYEQFREQRIKENMERMQKLGILDLSQNLKKSHTKPKPKPKPNPLDKKSHNPLPPSGSPRRSTRLKTLTPVSYLEDHPKRKRGSLRNIEIHILEGSQPEIYTEEHDKLLGDCKLSWTLSVDGYGKDGERIYDSVNGETCHQCRQKTLGLRTHCSQCTLVQGQFCGDCLYMRYGENVIEANQNPDWICPVCRGICNCSLCRKGKGWMPTGNLYRKVLKLGFKSVAHYLIQTRRSQSNLEDSDVKMEEDEVQCFDADINCAYNKGDDDMDTNDELNEKQEDVSNPTLNGFSSASLAVPDYQSCKMMSICSKLQLHVGSGSLVH